MLKYTPTDSVCDGPMTNLLSVLCILIETLSHARALGKQTLNGLMFGRFIGRFSSDDAASMAVKGLIAYCGAALGHRFINFGKAAGEVLAALFRLPTAQ